MMWRTLQGVVFIVVFVLATAREVLVKSECEETDLLCDGLCVNTTLQCNNEYDCIDGSDESFTTCGCRDDEFACPDRCIPLVERCDMNCTCEDCSDEEGCESFVCLPFYDQCKNHFCIPRHKSCNFIDDCGDNSDEEECNHPKCVSLFHFECDNHQCIALSYVCDGIEDCLDGSDELRCGTENFHFCGDGNKVHKSQVCNKKADCRNASDEHGCECNPGDPGQCPEEKRCFSYDIKCNNLCECLDCSDEASCGNPCDVTNGLFCPVYDFIMGSFLPSGCVRSERICNGPQDCGRYEDETFCVSGSHNFELSPCPHEKDKRLIPTSAFCDGQAYCMLGTDEQNCSTEVSTCGPGQFECTHLQMLCIDGAMRCDGFWNCRDYSDEEDCGEYVCPEETQFKCSGTGQCLASHQRCNGEIECVYVNGTKDESDEEDCHLPPECKEDEFRCHSGHCIEGWRRCYKAPDDYMFGCKDRSHLWDCGDWICRGDDQFKCPRDYCIVNRTRCNMLPDCANHADEENCTPYCHPLKYPECECDGEKFLCSDKGIRAIDLNHFTDDTFTWIDFSHNHVNVTQLMTGFQSNASLRLIHLELSHNNLQDLPPGLFQMMISLRFLDVGYNSINKIEKEAFRGLYNLKTLVLRGNIIQFIEEGSFYGLYQLRHLDLSHQRLVLISASSFVGLQQMHTLDVSNNPLQTVRPSAFFGLINIKTIDLSNNHVDLIHENTFKGLPHLKKIITDEFRFCCAVKHMAQDIECLPEGDEFSSCEDLMRNTFLRLNLWIVGLVATLCNAVVIVTRSGKRRDSRVQSFLITNLAIGDMCMGIYLLIIAVADFHFRGRYGIYDLWWRHSILCKLAGFLSTFSSELSVLSLTFITLHRVSSIVFPFRTKDMGFSRIVWIMASAWCIVFALAVIPLLGIPYFGNFYGRSGVCLALHITPDKPSGWEYSVFVFLVLNFFSFTFIAGAYIVMFYVARRTQQAAKRSLRSNKGSDAMARKMTLIVFTDFCCWMPIIVLGVASLCGARIHPQVFAWIAVFVLPLNSAVNPLLYTLWTAPYARQIINRARETILRSTATTEYKLSANLSTSEKFSSAMNGRRRGNRAVPGTSSVRLPPEKSTGSMRSSDVIHDPEETIRMNEMSHNKGNVYVNPNNNREGKIPDQDGNYEKLLNDKGMEVPGGHSSGEE